MKRTTYLIELAPGLFYSIQRRPSSKVLSDMRYGFSHIDEFLGDLPDAQILGRSLAIRYDRGEITLLDREKVQVQLDGITEQYRTEVFYL